MEKTDAKDASNSVLYLNEGLLPEVRMKDRIPSQIASLTLTRNSLVQLYTALKSKANNILSAHGINLAKNALSSNKALDELFGNRGQGDSFN